jgi:predicted ribosomally synthesized peptide with SipW-like signal peptide
MKKILLSLAAIVFVGAAAAGATGAFFSDNETSTGNTFTAGAIDLTVDSQSHYDGNTCVDTKDGNPRYQWQGNSAYPVPGTACDGTWSLTNLGVTNKFFNFGDVKPGDQGEDTVSLHVDNNPAWACAYIKTTSNDENTHTQPEINAGDTTAGPVGNGELAQNIHFFTWLDNASGEGAVPGDNIWQAGEPILQNVTALSATINGTTTLTLADASTGTPLPGGSTSYIGLGWCAGTLDTSVPGAWTCNGASMDNQSQTDSATADITFHVEQSRNNPNFNCIPRN